MRRWGLVAQRGWQGWRRHEMIGKMRMVSHTNRVCAEHCWSSLASLLVRLREFVLMVDGQRTYDQFVRGLFPIIHSD